MKYKIIFLFFLTSCISNTYTNNNNFTYSAKGFAYVESQSFDSLENFFFVSHNKLKLGTKLRISNPVNKKSIEIIVKKKLNMKNFIKF